MNIRFLLSTLLLLSVSSLTTVSQNMSQVKRELLEEVLEEKRKGITIGEAGNRENIATGVGAEPFIHVSRYDPELIGIAYMGEQASWELSFSEDGGVNWNNTPLDTQNLLQDVNPGAQILGGGDPTFTFDENGTIHLTYIYLFLPSDGSILDQSTYIFELLYAYSQDMGNTWTAGESLVSGTLAEDDLGFVDRIWMDVSPDGSTYCGGTHFSSSEDIGGQGTIVFKKEAGEFSFATPAQTAIGASLNSQTQFTNVETDNDGQMHVSGILITPDSETIVYTKSDTNGENYEPFTEIASSTAFPGQSEIHSRENAAVSLAVDDNNVYIAWSDFQSGDVLGYYAYSHDGGVTFSSPIEIGDLFFGDSHHTLMPCLAADDGNLAITWYSVDKTTNEGQYVAAFSSDAGLTLSSSFYNISDDFTQFSDFGAQAFFGDYNSMELTGAVAHIAWCDAHISGEPRVYYTSIDFNTATSIAEIQPLSESIQLSKIFPNPVQDKVNLIVNSKDDRDIKILLISSEGKLIKTKKLHISVGQTSLNINTQDIATGNYQIKLITDDGYVATKKLLKL